MFRILLIIILFRFQPAFANDDPVMTNPDSLEIADTLRTYKLSITSNLQNAKVYFDTAFAGFTPLIDKEVTEGDYEIRILNPKSPKEWESESKYMNVFVNKDTVIDVRFRYFYYFNSSPFSAEVFGSDSILGSTPLRLFQDSELTGKLIFRKKNYKDYIYDMVNYDFETGANIILESKGKETVNDLVYKDRVTQFKTRRSLITISALTAASIAGGYFAVTYKNKANEDYNKYLITGNNTFLDQSNSYDTYFVISLVLMQAAIGGLIYFLFFDK